MRRSAAPLAAVLALAACRSLSTAPGTPPSSFLAVGEVSPKAPAAARERLEAAVRLLDKSPSARAAAADWERRGGARVEVRVPAEGGPSGAHLEGVVTIASGQAAAEPAHTAMVLAHEWLGHKRCDLELEEALGKSAADPSTELVSRVRGWKAWLELDPPAALRDDELKRFVAMGPRGYRSWLRQPGRTYALSLDIEEMEDPETTLRGRLAAIRESQKAEDEKAGKEAGGAYDDWRRALGKASPAPRPSPPTEVYAHHGDPELARSIRRGNLKMTAEIAEQLLQDESYLRRTRAAAAVPALRRLAASWNAEIEDFHALAKARLAAARGKR